MGLLCEFDLTFKPTFTLTINSFTTMRNGLIQVLHTDPGDADVKVHAYIVHYSAWFNILCSIEHGLNGLVHSLVSHVFCMIERNMLLFWEDFP